MPGMFWKIGRSEERLFIRGHDNGKGPAPASCHHLTYVHIDRIDVGELLTVHLDGDECLIHETGDFFILKAFVRHDMTPVAGGIPDGEKNGFVLFSCRRKGLVVPGKPCNRVVCMLEKVGADLILESVPGFHYTLSLMIGDHPHLIRINNPIQWRDTSRDPKLSPHLIQPYDGSVFQEELCFFFPAGLFRVFLHLAGKVLR